MGSMASQITSLTIVYSAVYSGADQRKHQSSASLAFVRGIHRGPVNSPHKWPVTRKMFPFDDVIMFLFQLCTMLRGGQATRHWNHEHQVPHLLGPMDQWIGYDDHESLAIKVHTVRNIFFRDQKVVISTQNSNRFWNETFHNLNLTVPKLDYSGTTEPIPWLLMSRLLASPGLLQQWRGLCGLISNMSFSSIRKDSKHMKTLLREKDVILT